MSPSLGTKWITLDALDICLGGEPICRTPAWELRAGDRWWVRGPNGAGKSSFLRVAAGELWPAPGQHERRRYHFGGETTWSPMAARSRLTLLTPERQNRYLHQDWDLTAAEVVATGFLDTDLLHERPRPEEHVRLGELMRDLDLLPLWGRPFLQLSQGERRRVLIARALAGEPDGLLLDEFAEGLDEKARARFWQILESLAAAGKAIVLTTHRPGPALDGWHTLDIEPAAEARRSGHSAPERERGTLSNREQTLVRVRGDLYLEGNRLLKDLDWTLEEGAHTVVSGPNGCGKTSFLRLLWGELHPAFGGEIVHFQQADLTVHRLRRQVGYFQPDMHAWFRPGQEAGDVILSGFFATIDLVDPVTEDQREQMRRAAEWLGAGDWLRRPLSTLSYGQARRVLLARALVGGPRLALLDEPLDGLDHESRASTLEHLRRVAAAGGTTFVLTGHHGEDHPDWVRQHLRIGTDRRLEKLRDRAANLR